MSQPQQIYATAVPHGGAELSEPGTIQASARWRCMDTQTKREIWIIAVSTAILEAPAVAITLLAILAR
jgi:hypothetical protein